MKTLLFIFLAVFSSSSFAGFNSKEELFSAFSKAGFNHLVEVRTTDSVKNKTKVYSLDQNKETEGSLIDFEYRGDLSKRVPQLDFQEQGFFGTTAYEAVSIKEVVLCYRVSEKSALSFAQYGPKFLMCYFLSAKINDVVKSMGI